MIARKIGSVDGIGIPRTTVVPSLAMPPSMGLSPIWVTGVNHGGGRLSATLCGKPDKRRSFMSWGVLNLGEDPLSLFSKTFPVCAYH